MSLLCIKLRSFLGLVLHSDCISPPSPSSSSPPPALPSPCSPPPNLPNATCGGRLQEQEEECPTTNANGSKKFRSDVGHTPVHPSRTTGDAPLHGPAVHLQQPLRPTRARSSMDGASTAILNPACTAAPPPPPPTKPVQNIYRKPMSRINSNPSLRRSRDHYFRCNQRLSRHVQLYESDPCDVSCNYSPSGSTQISRVGPASAQGQVEEDSQGTQEYRRRVHTMPSAVPQTGPDAPTRGWCRKKVPRSLEIKRETGLARTGAQSPKDKQQLVMHNKDVL